jgi:hypothetical protein
MEQTNRCFQYDRSIVINALYDTIEELGWRVVDSDSVYGILSVSNEPGTDKLRVKLDVGADASQTRVSIHPEVSESGISDSLCAVLLDELAATIEKARQIISAKEDG